MQSRETTVSRPVARLLLLLVAAAAAVVNAWVLLEVEAAVA